MNNDNSNNLQNMGNDINGVQSQNVQPNIQPQNIQPNMNTVQVGQPQVQTTTNQVPAPAPVESIDANIPGPSTEEVLIPTSNTEQVVLETAPKKSGSNVILIIVALLLVVAVVYIEEIIAFVEENIITTNPSDVSDANSDNLVGGYILLADSTTNIKVNSIKFYNFKKKNDDFSVTLNYESEKTFKDVLSENIYIEFYNSNKDVLYKAPFNVEEGIQKDTVRTYSLILDSGVFESSMFALVKVYSEAELEKTKTLSCKLTSEGTGYSTNYKHDFTFKNDTLYSYTVNKKVNVQASSTNSTLALDELKKEYDVLTNGGLTGTYSEGSLFYTITLDKIEGDFIPLYGEGMTSFSIKNKETINEWECE